MEADLPRVRVTDPGDLISLVPYLVGFVPQDSLVLIWVADGRVRLTARMDLGASKDTFVSQVRNAGRRLPQADVVVLTWTSNTARARRVSAWARQAVRKGRLLDQLHCDGQRWWSWSCQDPACCPPEGTPVNFDSPAAAVAVVAGLSRAACREDVVRGVAGPPPSEWQNLLAELGEAVEHADNSGLLALDLPPLIRRLLPPSGSPRRADLLTLALLACVADGATLAASSLRQREDADDHVALWTQVVAVSPPSVAPGPLAVLGVAAWIAGQGAIATECCTRLEGLDPEHPMVPLLRAVSVGALPPAQWERLRHAV